MRFVASIALVAVPWLVACDTPSVLDNACEASVQSFRLRALRTTTTLTSTTTYGPPAASDASASDAAVADATVTSSTTVTHPTPVAVLLELEVESGCAFEGVANATLNTTLGSFAGATAATSLTVQLTAGQLDAAPAPTSAGGSGGQTDGTTAGSSSGAQSAVVGVAPLSSTLAGEVTLTLSTGETTSVRAVVGDTSACWTVSVGGLLDGGALVDGGLPAVGPATIAACAGQPAPPAGG